jgi:hypothetical protein
LESRSAGIAGREDPKVHGVRWAKRLPLRAIPAVRLPLDDIAIPPVCGVCRMHLYAILDEASRFAMRVPPHRCRHYSTRRGAPIRAESPNIARSACKVYSNMITAVFEQLECSCVRFDSLPGFGHGPNGARMPYGLANRVNLRNRARSSVWACHTPADRRRREGHRQGTSPRDIAT